MPYHGMRGDFLLGLVVDGAAFSLEEKALGGCRFCVLTLPQGDLRRRIAIERGVRGLRKWRVRRCVFPERFPEQGFFWRQGIEAVDVQQLLRKKAGHWVLVERQARGFRGGISVLSDRLTEEVKRTLCLLLEKTGSVSIPLLRGAEELQRELRRDCGAVLRLLPISQLSMAETLLDFSCSSLEGQALTLRLGESVPPIFLLPRDLREDFPAATNTAQLAAALWELGKVETEMIGLKSRM